MYYMVARQVCDYSFIDSDLIDPTNGAHLGSCKPGNIGTGRMAGVQKSE